MNALASALISAEFPSGTSVTSPLSLPSSSPPSSPASGPAAAGGGGGAGANGGLGSLISQLLGGEQDQITPMTGLVTPASLLAMAICFLILGILLTSVRFTTRKMQRLEVGWDDWLLIPALVLMLAMCVNVIAGVAMSRLGYNLPPRKDPNGTVDPNYGYAPEVAQGDMFQYIQEIFMPLQLMFTKMSIVLFYRRVLLPANRGVFHWLTLGVLGLLLLWGGVFTFGFIFPCGTKFYLYWNGPLAEAAALCINVQLEVGIILSDVILDIIILVLPLPKIFFKLQLSARKKLLVAFSFALGALNVVITITRAIVVFNVISGDGNPNGFTGDLLGEAGTTSTEVYWGLLESGLSIIVACLPALQYLVTRSGPVQLIRTMGHGLRSVSQLSFRRNSGSGSSSRAGTSHGRRGGNASTTTNRNNSSSSSSYDYDDDDDRDVLKVSVEKGNIRHLGLAPARLGGGGAAGGRARGDFSFNHSRSHSGATRSPVSPLSPWTPSSPSSMAAQPRTPASPSDRRKSSIPGGYAETYGTPSRKSFRASSVYSDCSVPPTPPPYPASLPRTPTAATLAAAMAAAASPMGSPTTPGLKTATERALGTPMRRNSSQQQTGTGTVTGLRTPGRAGFGGVSSSPGTPGIPGTPATPGGMAASRSLRSLHLSPTKQHYATTTPPALLPAPLTIRAAGGSGGKRASLWHLGDLGLIGGGLEQHQHQQRSELSAELSAESGVGVAAELSAEQSRGRSGERARQGSAERGGRERSKGRSRGRSTGKRYEEDTESEGGGFSWEQRREGIEMF